MAERRLHGMATLRRPGKVLFLRHGEGKADLFKVHRCIAK
jgi:hypothetical protein